MHKIVLNLTAMAISASLVPTTARAETDQSPTWSCVGSPSENRAQKATPERATDCPQAVPPLTPEDCPCGCIVTPECFLAYGTCARCVGCPHATTESTSVLTPAKDAPTLPPGGEWIQNEYWPMACYIVDHHVVLCESDPTGALREAVEALSSPSSSKPSAPNPARAAPMRSTPDCTRLVNENHPDCRP